MLYLFIYLLCTTLHLISMMSFEEQVYLDRLKDALNYDKGFGCDMPVLDPFDKEIMKHFNQSAPIQCRGQDWVKCYYSKCQLVRKILATTKRIMCSYREILHKHDYKYVLGTPVHVFGDSPYVLRDSDHVKIVCSGTHMLSNTVSNWVGIAVGFRKNVPKTPAKTSDSVNVLVFGFDSLSLNGCIRRLPKTLKYIKDELKMTILHRYNIVGDGTAMALFPILTGKHRVEIPEAVQRKSLDLRDFIFYKAKQHGYRTAYFEDGPWAGTFQWRYRGFKEQPADHYLRSFFLEDYKTSWQKYCVGDTPRHRIMMNITEQLMSFTKTKQFVFSFVADVSHDDFNMISHADEATVEFLKSFKEKGRTKDTLLVFMGDHGIRYSEIRKTFQGRLEERLPLMAFLLPENLLANRPDAQKALEENANVLTTPHDVHATLLDAMGLTQYIINVTIPGADQPRAMSLLKPIPKTRSCSEAGVDPQWCACTSWKTVPAQESMYQRVALALVQYINTLIVPVRSHCVFRTLTDISWVMKQQPRSKWLQNFKVTLGPGAGTFEGTVTYLSPDDTFSVDISYISRTNRYNNEPDCIARTHPHLHKFCYCNNLASKSSNKI